MRVEPTDDGLMVCPETDFEREYLSNFGRNEQIGCYVKCGLSVSADDVIGIKLSRPKKEKE